MAVVVVIITQHKNVPETHEILQFKLKAREQLRTLYSLSIGANNFWFTKKKTELCGGEYLSYIMFQWNEHYSVIGDICWIDYVLRRTSLITIPTLFTFFLSFLPTLNYMIFPFSFIFIQENGSAFAKYRPTLIISCIDFIKLHHFCWNSDSCFRSKLDLGRTFMFDQI